MRKYAWLTAGVQVLIVIGIIVCGIGAFGVMFSIGTMQRAEVIPLYAYYFLIAGAVAIDAGINICRIAIGWGKANMDQAYYNSLIPEEDQESDE